MATFQSIFPPNKETSTQIASLTNSTASSAVVLSQDAIFVITSDQNITIRFGNATNVTNAAATDWPLWANTYTEFQIPSGDDRFTVFNNSGTTANIWWWQLSRA
jgi:hypothetical protein